MQSSAEIIEKYLLIQKEAKRKARCNHRALIDFFAFILQKTHSVNL